MRARDCVIDRLTKPGFGKYHKVDFVGVDEVMNKVDFLAIGVKTAYIGFTSSAENRGRLAENKVICGDHMFITW